MQTVRTLLLLVIVAAACALGVWWYVSPEASHVTVHKAAIKDITPMVRLCALDIYEDVPVRGQIGDKHIFARAVVNGSVTFDLEKMKTEERGDTLLVTLPPERVEVYESTEPGSYVVIDTWSDSFFGSSTFTTAEENAVKEKARRDFRAKVYDKGYVRRARSEAVTNLTQMLSGLTGKTVIVSDPSPEGYR